MPQRYRIITLFIIILIGFTISGVQAFSFQQLDEIKMFFPIILRIRVTQIVATRTPTITPTWTVTKTLTPFRTLTPLPTNTVTPTYTITNTVTSTPTETPTETYIPLPSITLNYLTPTRTLTLTPVRLQATPTSTPVPGFLARLDLPQQIGLSIVVFLWLLLGLFLYLLVKGRFAQ